MSLEIPDGEGSERLSNLRRKLASNTEKAEKKGGYGLISVMRDAILELKIAREEVRLGIPFKPATEKEPSSKDQFLGDLVVHVNRFALGVAGPDDDSEFLENNRDHLDEAMLEMAKYIRHEHPEKNSRLFRDLLDLELYEQHPDTDNG